MPRKEFVGLMEDNMRVLGWIGTRMKVNPKQTEYSKQHLETLMRLHVGGRAMLKDIAKRSHMSAPNLCSGLKHLEKDGLVVRQIDDSDRRNTWYSLTPAGDKIAENTLAELRDRIEELFSGLGKTDEARLTSALRTMNELLNKIKTSYNKGE